MAKSYSKIKLFDRSIDLLKKALRLDFLNHGKDNTFVRATLYMSLGNEYFNLHRYDWAEKAYRTSLRIFTQIGNACCLSTCHLYKMLHLIYLGWNDPISAELCTRESSWHWNATESKCHNLIHIIFFTRKIFNTFPQNECKW